MKDIDIMFGMYHPEGGTTGEMCIRWVELSGKLTPQLQSYDDSWGVLALFTDVIQKMGEVDGEDISEEDFAKLLDSCGFTDMTTYSTTSPETQKLLDDLDYHEKELVRIRTELRGTNV